MDEQSNTPPEHTAQPMDGERPMPSWLIVSVVVIVALALGYWFMFAREETPTTPPPPPPPISGTELPDESVDSDALPEGAHEAAGDFYFDDEIAPLD